MKNIAETNSSGNSGYKNQSIEHYKTMIIMTNNATYEKNLRRYKSLLSSLEEHESKPEASLDWLAYGSLNYFCPEGVCRRKAPENFHQSSFCSRTKS